MNRVEWDGVSDYGTYRGKQIRVENDGAVIREKIASFIEELYVKAVAEDSPRLSSHITPTQIGWLLEKNPLPLLEINLPLRNNLKVKELGDLA